MSREPEEKSEWLDRTQARSIVTLIATAVSFYLCFLISRPFIAALIWAVAIAVLLFPAYRWFSSRVPNKNLAAGCATVLVAAALIVPLYLTARNLALEIWSSVETLRSELGNNEWRRQLESSRIGASALDLVERNVDLASTLEQAANQLPGLLSGFLSGSAWLVFQFLVMVFALFFFLRDHEFFLEGTRRYLPFTAAETNSLFRRVSDTLHATVFGEILVALFQGVAGGVMFWILGLPAPVFWGFVMGMLGFLPAVGTWLVWAPAAVSLFMQDEWIKGIVLIVWGVLVLTLLTTLIYPMLVGDRLRLHTLVVFIAILGGIWAFGMVGIIVGPMAIGMTIALVQIWKQRISSDEKAEPAT